MSAMRQLWKIAGIFASAGFFLPLLLLAYSVLTGKQVDGLLFWLCPSAIISMALDHAATSTAIEVWLIIATSNALLYAAPWGIVGLFVALWRPGEPPPGIFRN